MDGTDPRSLSAGEIEARRQIDDIHRYLVEYVPGFEKAHFTKTAPFLGIRETRRIVGQYVMNRDDILSCRRFDDAIAVAQLPDRPASPERQRLHAGVVRRLLRHPLSLACCRRSMDNLLVAGRCISTTHEAMAAIRVMSTCMAMGEAAGRAAKMAVAEGVSPSGINVPKLREELLARGAYLRG